MRSLVATVLLLATSLNWAATYDADEALAVSQAAIGRQLGALEFVDSSGQQRKLQEFAGQPLLLSMVFTSCHHICPMTTRNLKEAVIAAREVLDSDSFTVLTVGFDTRNDRPQAMAEFAREQGVDKLPNWHFLSGSAEAVAALSAAVGFQFFPSSGGFDHLVQLTLIGRDSAVYRQVYGVDFELPAMMEPLKQVVYNQPQTQGHFVASLVDRVRLFCTVYNPATGRYEIDNTLFIQMAIGFLIIVSAAVYLWRGMRTGKRSRVS